MLVEKLDSKTMVNLINKRSKGYSVLLRNGEYYEWLPSKDGFEDSVELPFKDVQSIHTTSSTFKDGYLFIDNPEVRKRLGLENEEIKPNLMSREEIEKALNGNMAQFNQLLKVTNRQLLREIVDIAKEIKLSNVNKLQKLADVSGIPLELMLEEEEK